LTICKKLSFTSISFLLDTSRTRENGEIDGSDYHFISRTQFETEAANGKFLEHGEYDKQFYGTSLDRFLIFFFYGL
jgi:guanylate kinase